MPLFFDLHAILSFFSRNYPKNRYPKSEKNTALKTPKFAVNATPGYSLFRDMRWLITSDVEIITVVNKIWIEIPKKIIDNVLFGDNPFRNSTKSTNSRIVCISSPFQRSWRFENKFPMLQLYHFEHLMSNHFSSNLHPILANLHYFKTTKNCCLTPSKKNTS